MLNLFSYIRGVIGVCRAKSPVECRVSAKKPKVSVKKTTHNFNKIQITRPPIRGWPE